MYCMIPYHMLGSVVDCPDDLMYMMGRSSYHRSQAIGTWMSLSLAQTLSACAATCSTSAAPWHRACCSVPHSHDLEGTCFSKMLPAHLNDLVLQHL